MRTVPFFPFFPKGEKSGAEDVSEFAPPGANSRAFEPTPRAGSLTIPQPVFIIIADG